MRAVLLLLVFAACQKKEAPKASFIASCKPDAIQEQLDCVVENVGKVKGRACITPREIPPMGQPLIARRICTKELAPGEKISLRPHFDNIKTLQPACSPQGKWECKDELVEKPEQIGENIASPGGPGANGK